MKEPRNMKIIPSSFEGETKEEISFLSEEPIKIVQEEAIEEAELFEHYDLHEALLWVDDIFERGLVKWILVGDLGEQLHKYDNPSLSADKVEIMVLRTQLTESGRSTIGTWIPAIRDENATEVMTNYEGVPIYIKIIDEDPGYLGNPDKKFYYISDIYLPNPFEDYVNDRNN